MIKLLLHAGDEKRDLEFAQFPVSIGRSKGCSIVLPDKKASRTHARIDKVDGYHTLQDLGSWNGTQVNGEPVKSRALAKGDAIQVGRATLTVVDLDDPPPVPSPAPPPRTVLRAAPVHPWIKPALTGLAIIMGGLVLLKFLAIVERSLSSPRDSSATPTAPVENKAPSADDPEAQAVLAELAQRVRAAERVSTTDLAAVEATAQMHPGSAAEFDRLGIEIKRRLKDQMNREAFNRAVQKAEFSLRQGQYAEAQRPLDPHRSGPYAEEASELTARILDAMERDFATVAEFGRKLEAEGRFANAAEYYHLNAPRFRETAHASPMAGTIARLEARAAEEPPKSDVPRDVEPLPLMKAAEPAAPAPPPEPKAAMAPPSPLMETPVPVAVPASSALPMRMPENPCDAKRTVKGIYCPTCDRLLDERGIRDALCKRCESEPRKVDLCRKIVFRAGCHPDRAEAKPFSCCGEVWDKPGEDTARMAWLCESCGDAGITRSDVHHVPDCRNRLKVTSVCLKSGTSPHVPAPR